MEFTFLGTGSMVPTKERNHSAFFLTFKAEGFLFDCGEGTQRQFRKAGIRPTKITRIFLSHWHGDHVLGLPGLLDTLAASDYPGTLYLYGPEGTKERLKYLRKAFYSQQNIPLVVEEILAGVVLDTPTFRIEAHALNHGVPAFGYRFIEKDRRRIDLKKAKTLGLTQGPLLGKLQQGSSVKHEGKTIKPADVTYVVKGRIIGYIADTAYTKSLIKIAKQADLLVCESSFENALEKQAKTYAHLTAAQAASIAKDGEVKQLALIHLSSRYATPKLILAEARKVFKATSVPDDLAVVSLGKP